MSNTIEANKYIELVNSTLLIIKVCESVLAGYEKELNSEVPDLLKDTYTYTQWNEAIKSDIDSTKNYISTSKDDLERYQEQIHYYIADYSGDYKTLIK